jgi:hypothetical protein
MSSAVGARFGSQTSYQFCDAYSLLRTPRGGRLTVPMRSPSPLNLSVPRRTIRIAMICLLFNWKVNVQLQFRQMGGYDVAIQSAQNYRQLRKDGITVRKTIEIFTLVDYLCYLFDCKVYLSSVFFLVLIDI